MSISDLPTLNAVLNSLSALQLALGFLFIRNKNIRAHRASMVGAFSTSTIFLASYLTYHYYHGATRFPGQGAMRWFYLGILLTHTILAVVIVPMIFVTLTRALRGQFDQHRKIARWTLPLWLYVSVTGVIVYLMLYRLYPTR